MLKTRILLSLVLASSGAAQELALEGWIGGDPLRRLDAAHPIAWCRTASRGVLWSGPEGEEHPVLESGAWLEAPIAAPPQGLAPGSRPAAIVRVRVGGSGRLRIALLDALGAATHEAAVSGAEEVGWRVERRLAPRATLRFEVSAGAVSIHRLSCQVTWAGISRPLLRALVEAEAAWLAGCIERSRDVDGPRPTALLTRLVDPASGALIAHRPAGHHPYYDALLDWYAAQPDAELRARLLAYARDLLDCGVDRRSGLARLHDGREDRPVGSRAVDPRGALGFLIRAARELGPPAALRKSIATTLHRARATLRAGQAADGSWSSRWIPASGQPGPDMPIIRALRTAALVAELEAQLGLGPDLEAAWEALLNLELRLHWPGTAEFPDPGLDDYFGHLGRDALSLAEVEGSDGPFRRFFGVARARYLSVWRRSQRAGGTNAPDQVRAFELFLASAAGEELDRLERECLLSWRNLARSTQLPGGAFADVTSVDFAPRLNMPVGDLPLVPFHLLRLGALLHGGQGLDEDDRAELRAVCGAALLALRAHRGPAGYGRGVAGAGATARLFSVLAEWRLALN